jgi:hypothetical protein
MAREAPRCKQQNINPGQIAGTGISMGNRFRRCTHSPQSPWIDCLIQQIGGGAPLHLNKDYSSTAPGDQINFPAGSLEPARQNPPASEAQIPCRQRFASPALRLAPGTLVHFSSMARV